MDYNSIMKLSGHKSYTEFLNYVSVNKEDLIKGSKLYRLDSSTEEDELNEIIKIVKSLDPKNRTLVLQLVRNF